MPRETASQQNPLRRCPGGEETWLLSWMCLPLSLSEALIVVIAFRSQRNSEDDMNIRGPASGGWGETSCKFHPRGDFYKVD